jgi:sigma-54 dependent transcriptional regulator, acetoin dehydrogenase operon transcriptional activator AcoR
MMDTADRRLQIAAAREGFLTSGTARANAVPDVVAASWRRSLTAGVDAETSEAVFYPDLDTSSRLVRCSRPIIERLSAETADIPLSIALTDSKARVLTRLDTSPTIGLLLDDVWFASGFGYAETCMGTNGVGTVFESGRPIQIVGPEHFHEHLQPFACSGAPIRDPLSGRIEGVLDISCLTEHSSPLMHSLVRSAAHDIERNLMVDRSHRQLALFETFVRAEARSRGAVMAVGGTVVMASAVAQGLLEPAEQATIHEYARYLMNRQDRAVDQLELSTGKVVRVKGTRVVVGTEVAGMVIEIALVADGPPTIHGPMDADHQSPAGVGAKGGTNQGPAPHPPVTPTDDGRSTVWRRACTEIASALSDRRPLLVIGETGSGKSTLVLELFHRANPGGRSLLESAGGITLPSSTDADGDREPTRPLLHIFKNIDQLSATQVQQLDAFLSELADSDRPEYVAATLADAKVEADLPYRKLLAHFKRAVTVPPLRHRTEDIPGVVGRVLGKISQRRTIQVAPAALRVLSRYSWPGNITQLEQTLTAALAKRPVGAIQPDDLPGFCHDSAKRQLTGMEAVERDAIVKALRDADGNRVQAAVTLGIARSSLYRKLRSFGIATI